MPKVKICGITNLSDALAAVDAGADALGFMFYAESPRVVSETAAAEIIRELPPFVAKVGVFVNAPSERVTRLLDVCGLDTLQFHGDEPPEFCRQFRTKIIKAFRVRDEKSLRAMAAYESEAWLLDAFVPGKLGGTGARFNWELARQATALSPRVILAGGLTPANVSDAIRQVQPYGVDVSSGVEAAPGKKDPIKVRDFIAAVKAATR
ncbi:MAG: phosphoribosylanthranilate isomerase [Verrucomicrobia bacterium]|nr:phosphoribosylanthranilate isomerase [Verrucomicrobiota bacterium]